MFGHHAAKRQKKRLKREQESFNNDKAAWEKASPEREREESEFQTKHASEKASQAKTDRAAAREEGRADTEAFLAKDIEGMDPAKRQALQYEANKGIQRSHQQANRKLLGDQSMHGVVGKGGVGYAQQRDLSKMASEAQGQASRDLTKLDSDLALKKKAAIFAGGQGEASQQQLDKQMAIDELQLQNEKKRQRNFEDQFYKQFSRV